MLISKANLASHLQAHLYCSHNSKTDFCKQLPTALGQFSAIITQTAAGLANFLEAV